MTSEGEFAIRARSWLASAVGRYGRAARRGLDEAQDLALARAYQRAKYEAGFAGINLPAEIGGSGLSHLEKLAFDAAELPLGMPTDYFSVSLGMPVPIVARFVEDRDWVRRRVVAALRGDEIWCQLFSEPAAGSDLAALRTRAEPDGNGWRVTGQKLWISWAHYSDYGVIVTRTDPKAPKHRGLTYFWVDMKSPGIETRPIRLANGGAHVNEVFFDSVRLSDAQRIGAVGGGFAVAMATLMIERYVATDSRGFGPGLESFIELARRSSVNGAPALSDGRVRSVIARNHALRAGLDAITVRAMLTMAAGGEPGPEGALNKLVSVRSRQKLSEFAMDLQGANGLALEPFAGDRDHWGASWLNAPIGRIAGGADEMLLNTIAEKILGLPQDHRPDKSMPFDQIAT